MSGFRRRLMMAAQGGGQSPYDDFGYVKDGKIFHLDGINKGDNADAWTDLVNGIVFTTRGGITRNVDNFYFSGTTRNGFQSNGSLSVNTNATVEVCYIPLNIAHCLFIYKRDAGMPVFYNDNNTISFLQNNKTYTCAITIGSKYTMSFNLTEGVLNGNTISPNNKTDYWSNDDNIFYIGARRINGNNPFKGTLYSIRIYGRRLTNAEMLHNQQVDNTRFNLGLTI